MPTLGMDEVARLISGLGRLLRAFGKAAGAYAG
jgi:hypothetical protein